MDNYPKRQKGATSAETEITSTKQNDQHSHGEQKSKCKLPIVYTNEYSKSKIEKSYERIKQKYGNDVGNKLYEKREKQTKKENSQRPEQEVKNTHRNSDSSVDTMDTGVDKNPFRRGVKFIILLFFFFLFFL